MSAEKSKPDFATASDQVMDLDSSFVMHTYGRLPVEFASGHGATLVDTSGKEYIDLGAGIAVTSFGIADSEWAAAVTQQLTKLQHCSNLYFTGPCALLAEKLCEATGMKKVFFGNSGAEANECAIKAARKYSFDKYGPDRYKIVTLVDSFHGRTIATLSATGQPELQNGFQPMVPGFIYTPANDCEALKALVESESGICAFMFELIQGESGVTPATYDYLVGAYAFAKQKGILLILDEVQTGTGRTGKFYCFEHYGIQPDIVTLAKGLGGGVPIAACLARGEAAEALEPGDHGSTFGGGPLACAAANVVVKKLTEEGLLERVTEAGDYLADQLSSKLARHKFVLDIRGKGLLRGVQLDEKLSAASVVGKMMSLGVIIGTCGHNTLRIAPPYIISRAEIDDMTDKLETIFSNTNI